MRTIDKTITVKIDDHPVDFRLRKPDAFSGVEILRLLMRLQDQKQDENPTVYDLVLSFTEEEMRSVMKSCLNHTYVMLPAGPNPVMTGDEWAYPEISHDMSVCMKLMLEEITWTLEGFFVAGGLKSQPASPDTSPSNA